ncbi:unnamed protein product [Amoebophrya sp. A120]|nr:unnamed protein product [Amoebophrya sp. A120]|eukprot:GSA120T00016537001.1
MNPLEEARRKVRERKEREQAERDEQQARIQRELEEAQRWSLRSLITMLCCGGANRNQNRMPGGAGTLLQDADSTGNATSPGGKALSGGASKADGRNKDANKNNLPLVLGKYEVQQGRAGVLGEGSFSVVQRGTDVNTGKVVAVKTYKISSKDTAEDMENCVTKFKRQIEVLQMLMEPLDKKFVTGNTQTANLHHPVLMKIDPRKCFLELLDFSKDKNGKPGPDMKDGKLYVVTEVADYSLKDYLGQKLAENGTLSRESVRQICRSFLIAMAMLHVKGLVHLDMKPENIMRAGDTWKVIDVDGCTPLGKQISINDSSISFSPCYCAPEWANFLIEDGDFLKVGHQLDVWSVGVSLCELITLDAVLKPKYVSIYRNTGSHRKAGFLFLEWLANGKEGLALDQSISKFDPEFTDMVLTRMLNKNPMARVSLADMLNHNYVKDCIVPGLDTTIDKKQEHLGDKEKVKKHRLERLEVKETDQPPLIKGVLWKLNSDGDKENVEHWLRRDVWLDCKGNLCYYSQKKNKRLVILDVKHLATAKLSKTGEKSVDSLKCALPHVICVDFVLEESELSDETKNAHETQYYAAESHEELKKWCKALENVIQNPDKFDVTDGLAGNQKVHVSASMVEEFRELRKMRNRREKIDNHPQYQPVFEKELWKLNSDGDALQETDWTFRKMWLAKNGALCYFSKKENKELMYYRPEDIRQVTYRKLKYPQECCRPHAFELALKTSGDKELEFAPGVFAAEEESVMAIILGCIEKYQKIKNSATSS